MSSWNRIRDTDLQDETGGNESSSKQLLDRCSVYTLSTGWQAWPSDLSKRDWLHAMDLRARKVVCATNENGNVVPPPIYPLAFIMVRAHTGYIGYIARRNRGVSTRRVGMHHRRQSRANTTVPIECMRIIKDIVRRLIKQTRTNTCRANQFFFFYNRHNLFRLDRLERKKVLF